MNRAGIVVLIFELDGNGVFALPYLELDELPAIVWFDAARGAVGKAGEVIQNAGLVNDEVWELRDANLVIDGAGAADNVLAVFWIRVPEGHLGDLVGLFGDFLGKAEGLESLHGTGLDAVCLAQDEAVRAALDDASVDAREHRQLCSRDHARGPGAHDEDVHGVWQLAGAVDAITCGLEDAGVLGNITIVVELHCDLLVGQDEVDGMRVT